MGCINSSMLFLQGFVSERYFRIKNELGDSASGVFNKPIQQSYRYTDDRIMHPVRICSHMHVIKSRFGRVYLNAKCNQEYYQAV